MVKVTKDSSLDEIKKEFELVNKKMEGLEAKEPADENSPEYEAWCEECETLAVDSETLMSLIDYKMTQSLQGDSNGVRKVQSASSGLFLQAEIGDRM